MAKTKQVDNHRLNEIKTSADGIFVDKIAALENARKDFPCALDKYIESLEKNGVETGHAEFVLKHLELYDPVIVLQALRDAAKDGGKIGNVQAYVPAILMLGVEDYAEVRKDCRRDGGKLGDLLNYACIIEKYGGVVYHEALNDCREDKAALGKPSDYAWFLDGFRDEYARVRKKLASEGKVDDSELFSERNKTSLFIGFCLD